MQSYDLTIQTIKRAVAALVVPVGVLTVLFIWLAQSGRVNPVVIDYLYYLPYLFLAPGMALAWRFNRSRAFFVMSMIALAHWGMYGLIHDPALPSAQTIVAYALMCFLFPINAAVFAVVAERGIFTKRGFIRMGALGIQAGLVLWAASNPEATAMSYFFAGDQVSGVLGRQVVPYVAQLSFMAGFAVMIFQLFRHRSALDGGFLGALAAVFMAFNSDAYELHRIAYFAAAGAIMLVSLVQDSYNMAYFDELTGLPGRRALNEQLLKLGNKYVIAMVDVDHFKKFNDTYGHDVGDQVLRFVAAKLDHIKGGGKAYRYGGEEFTVLFPNQSAAGAIAFLEQIHEMIGRTEFVLRAKDRPKDRPKDRSQNSSKSSHDKVHVTVSIGVADRNEKRGSPREVLKAADASLYAAKQAGRNTIWY